MLKSTKQQVKFISMVWCTYSNMSKILPLQHVVNIEKYESYRLCFPTYVFEILCVAHT